MAHSKKCTSFLLPPASQHKRLDNAIVTCPKSDCTKEGSKNSPAPPSAPGAPPGAGGGLVIAPPEAGGGVGVGSCAVPSAVAEVGGAAGSSGLSCAMLISIAIWGDKTERSRVIEWRGGGGGMWCSRCWTLSRVGGSNP